MPEPDVKDKADKDPRETQTFQEIVESADLNFEKHTVTTDDGYILDMFRI